MPLHTMSGTIVPQAGNLCLRQLWEAVQARKAPPTRPTTTSRRCSTLAAFRGSHALAVVELSARALDLRRGEPGASRDPPRLPRHDGACPGLVTSLVLETATRLPPRLDLNQADLSCLPDQARQIETIREKTLALLADLEQPWPPLDPSRIPAGKGKAPSLQEALADLGNYPTGTRSRTPFTLILPFSRICESTRGADPGGTDQSLHEPCTCCFGNWATRLRNDPAPASPPGRPAFAFQLVVNNRPGPLHVFTLRGGRQCCRDGCAAGRLRSRRGRGVPTP